MHAWNPMCSGANWDLVREPSSHQFLSYTYIYICINISLYIYRVRLAFYGPPTTSPTYFKLPSTFQIKGVAQSQESCRPWGLGAIETMRASLKES